MSEHNDKIREYAVKIAKYLDEKKALDVKVLNVFNSTVIADYFVIAHTDSVPHLRALADDTEQEMGLKEGIAPTHKEISDSWILLDYDSIIVHIFIKDARTEYKLEKLWADAEEIKF